MFSLKVIIISSYLILEEAIEELKSPIFDEVQEYNGMNKESIIIPM